MLFKDPIATGQITVNATPAQAYHLITDPPAMAILAEEIIAAHWLEGAAHAAVGARFRGINRNGRRRWITICRVTDAIPDRRFAYDVSTPFGVPISRWQYDVEPAPDGQGCVITETNWLRIPLWFIPFAILITGVSNRAGSNNSHIAITLSRLKARLESFPITGSAGPSR